jgi:hypothetical protein
MVKIVAYVSTPVWSSVIGPPLGPSVRGSWRVRSGLIVCHDWPPSRVRKTWLPPA